MNIIIEKKYNDVLKLAMELLKEEKNTERYYKKKYSHEKY